MGVQTRFPLVLLSLGLRMAPAQSTEHECVDRYILSPLEHFVFHTGYSKFITSLDQHAQNM